MDRRSCLGILSTGVVTGIAGCSSIGSGTESLEDQRTILPGGSDLSASDFRSIAAQSHDTYSTGGVWGQATSEPDHELTFQSAWTTALPHDDGVESTHLLTLYRLPPGPDGAEASQVWLWSGVNPTESTEIHRISTGISLPKDGSRLGIYSPAQEYHAADVSSYPVESGRLDVVTLEATMPLSSGQVGIDEQTQVGDGGAYVPFWEGGSGTAQTLAATTEIRWPKNTGRELAWTVAVELTG